MDAARARDKAPGPRRGASPRRSRAFKGQAALSGRPFGTDRATPGAARGCASAVLIANVLGRFLEAEARPGGSRWPAEELAGGAGWRDRCPPGSSRAAPTCRRRPRGPRWSRGARCAARTAFPLQRVRAGVSPGSAREPRPGRLPAPLWGDFLEPWTAPPNRRGFGRPPRTPPRSPPGAAFGFPVGISVDSCTARPSGARLWVFAVPTVAGPTLASDVPPPKCVLPGVSGGRPARSIPEQTAAPAFRRDRGCRRPHPWFVRFVPSPFRCSRSSAFPSGEVEYADFDPTPRPTPVRLHPHG
jgi:hypothetical protein